MRPTKEKIQEEERFFTFTGDEKDLLKQAEFLSAYFIANGSTKTLPYIKDDGFFRNINIISFEIPESDKKLLTETVKNASKYLI